MTSRTLDNAQQVTALQLEQQSATPATPDTSHSKVYMKSDGLYVVDDSDAVSGPLAAAVMTELASDPSAPDTSKWQFYFKAGGLYIIDDAGAVTGPLIAAVSFVGASLALSGDMTLGTGSNTLIDWNVEDYDTDSFHEGVTNPSRLTVPEDGKYTVSVGVPFVGANGGSGGLRRIRLVKNGTVAAVAQEDNVTDDTTTAYCISKDFDCSAGDYFHIAVYQANEIDITIDADYAYFCIKKVG